MERAKAVKQKAQDIIQSGRKPSALALSSELDFSEADIHRCLNYLERNGEVQTYTRDVFGTKHRMVGVKR